MNVLQRAFDRLLNGYSPILRSGRMIPQGAVRQGIAPPTANVLEELRSSENIRSAKTLQFDVAD